MAHVETSRDHFDLWKQQDEFTILCLRIGKKLGVGTFSRVSQGKLWSETTVYTRDGLPEVIHSSSQKVAVKCALRNGPGLDPKKAQKHFSYERQFYSIFEGVSPRPKCIPAQSAYLDSWNLQLKLPSDHFGRDIFWEECILLEPLQEAMHFIQGNPNLMKQFTTKSLLALGEFHQFGIHCDLKPDNLFVRRYNDSDDFDVVLGDVGMAYPRNSPPELTGGNFMCGSAVLKSGHWKVAKGVPPSRLPGFHVAGPWDDLAGLIWSNVSMHCAKGRGATRKAYHPFRRIHLRDVEAIWTDKWRYERPMLAYIIKMNAYLTDHPAAEDKASDEWKFCLALLQALAEILFVVTNQSHNPNHRFGNLGTAYNKLAQQFEYRVASAYKDYMAERDNLELGEAFVPAPTSRLLPIAPFEWNDLINVNDDAVLNMTHTSAPSDASSVYDELDINANEGFLEFIRLGSMFQKVTINPPRQLTIVITEVLANRTGFVNEWDGPLVRGSVEHKFLDEEKAAVTHTMLFKILPLNDSYDLALHLLEDEDMLYKQVAAQFERHPLSQRATGPWMLREVRLIRNSPTVAPALRRILAIEDGLTSFDQYVRNNLTFLQVFQQACEGIAILNEVYGAHGHIMPQNIFIRTRGYRFQVVFDGLSNQLYQNSPTLESQSSFYRSPLLGKNQQPYDYDDGVALLLSFVSKLNVDVRFIQKDIFVNPLLINKNPQKLTDVINGEIARCCQEANVTEDSTFAVYLRILAGPLIEGIHEFILKGLKRRDNDRSSVNLDFRKDMLTFIHRFEPDLPEESDDMKEREDSKEMESDEDESKERDTNPMEPLPDSAVEFKARAFTMPVLLASDLVASSPLDVFNMGASEPFEYNTGTGSQLPNDQHSRIFDFMWEDVFGSRNDGAAVEND